MNECDKLNSFNNFISANYTEPQLLLDEPKKVTNTVQEKLMKNGASKEAEKVATSGYSSNGYSNRTSYGKSSSSSSSYSGGYGSSNYYSNTYYSKGNTTSYTGNNLDYQARLSSIKAHARKEAEARKKFAQTRGVGLTGCDCKYTFTIDNNRVKHASPYKRTNKLFTKKMFKQAAVAVGIILAEAALGVVMSEAKEGINSITNEVRSMVNQKTK